MKHILSAYLKRLTNLSQRNRSLLLLRNSAQQDIDFQKFTALTKDNDLSFLKPLLKGSSMNLTENLDPRSGKRDELAKRLQSIKRRDDFLFRESGVKDLYLGWPFVQGKLRGGAMVRCPLIFFPVQLELENNTWKLQARKDVNITFNKSFLLAYGYYNEIAIDDEFLETVFNEYELEPRPFLTSLYQELKESTLELNFNQDLFQEKLIPFVNFNRDEYKNKYDEGTLKLFSEAVLGIFPQSGSHLVSDYKELIESNHFKDLEDFFAQRNPVNQQEEIRGSTFRLQFLNKLKEEDLYTPFSIDASQENAMKAVKKHNSMVIQGPPGSGKSQLICNLISDFCSRGKKVLVVCQKRAALDVVYARMKEIKADRFCALVHDFKNDRKDIYEKIASQIDSLSEFEQINNGLDNILLERNYLKVCRNIDNITEELEDFKTALYSTDECGNSPKELYLKSNPEEAAVSLSEEFSQFRFDEIGERKNKWTHFAELYFRFEEDDYLWRNRNSFAEFTATDLNVTITALNEIPVFRNQVNEKADLFAKRDFNLEEHLEILEHKKDLNTFLRILENEEYWNSFTKYINAKTDDLMVQNRQRIIMECFEGEGIESTTKTDELGEVQRLLENAKSKRKNIVNWWLYSLFSKESYPLKRVLVSNGLELNPEHLSILDKKLDNRMNLEHNLSFLRKQKWLADLPKERDQESIERWFDVQNKALQAKAIVEKIRPIRQNFKFEENNYDNVKYIMDGLILLSELIYDKFKVWNKHLSKVQINEMLFSESRQEELIKVLRADFEDLCFYDRMRAEMDSSELILLEKVLDHPEINSPDQVFHCIWNSLALTWIEHLEKKYPELRLAGSSELDLKISELQKSIDEKLEYSSDILLMRFREMTYKSLEYNRLNNLVSYRDLKHQVTKKRRIWPLRQLISNYFEELFNLIPCWMASPDSVSAMFPLEDLFDLVIFDEASQCFSEQGIPAVYRSKQVVILGDSKQLPPNNLYQIRYKLDEEEDIDLERDSLLDLGEKYLMSTQLKGHYRSASLDLIDFSNKHFYNNTLRFLPSPNTIFSMEKAIEYHYLKYGIWEDNVNKVEADELVKVAFDYIKKGETSIGIITFNYYQQNLIQDLLEEKAIKEEMLVPDELFVKNIENVQGDERDIILFSISYAKDGNGKLRHNFALLNTLNGENRLNVAITRVRKKIHLFASIMPHELETENLAHRGPKLLKEYLQYAYEVSKGDYKAFFRMPNTFNPDWYLKNYLQAWMMRDNVNLSMDLPFVDLMVWKEEDKAKLVFTDDEIFFNSYSAKEVFAYRPMELSKKNWDYSFVFSRKYWLSSEDAKVNLKRFIDR